MANPLNYFFRKFKEIDLLMAISIAVLILFIGSLVTAFLFPIYPDEISMRIWLSRFPYDYPLLSSNLPACTSSFLQPIPLGLFLPGIVDWFIHGMLSSPFQFRLVGLIFLLILIGSPILFSTYQLRKSRAAEGVKSNLKLALISAAFICGLFSIGVNPVFLIINRGEQLILFALVISIFTYLMCMKGSFVSSVSGRVLVLLIFLISVSLALHAHGKAFFLLPFFGVVAYELIKSFRLSFLGKLLFIGSVILITYDSYYVFKVAYSCPEIPEFNQAMKTFSIDPSLIVSSPAIFFGKCIESLIDSYRFALSISFNEIAEVNYLPSIPLSKKAKLVNYGIWSWLIVSIPALFLFLVKSAFNKSSANKQINQTLLILAICLLISAVFDLTKNWYAGPYLYSGFALVGIIYLAVNYPTCYSRSSFKKYLIVFALFSVCSQAIFINRNLLKFKNEFVGLGPKVSTFNSERVEKSLEVLAKSCDIKRDQSSKLVLDDVTYLFFKESRWPISQTFIFGGSDQFLREYFQNIDSDGLVVRCSDPMYKKYGGLLKGDGEFCCISKENLKKLP